MLESYSNLAQHIYASKLRMAYGAPGREVYDPDYASLSDPEIWDKCRRDPVVTAALELRAAKTAGSTSRVMPAGSTPQDDRLADIVQDAIQEIEDWDEVRIRSCEAVTRGSSWGWVVWRRKRVELGGLGPKKWCVPTEVRDVDRRRFKQKIIEPGSPCWALYSPTRNAWEKLEPQDLRNFLRITYRDTEDALGHGRGLLEAVYHYQYFRDQAIQRFLNWCDKLGGGQIVAKLDGFRAASRNNAAVAAEWRDMLESLRVRHVAVFDKLDEIDVITGGEAGAAHLLEFINYCDKAIMHLLSGGHLQLGSPSGASDSGSLAQSQTHAESGDSLIDRDQKKLCASVKRDVIAQFVRLNAPVLASLGLCGRKIPSFSVIPEEAEDIHQSVQDACQLLDRGVPLLKDDLYRRCGWSAPTQEDIKLGRTITAKQEQPQPFPGLGRMPGFTAYDASFREVEHPRKNDGKFAPKGQGESGGKKEKSKKRAAPGSQLSPDVVSRLNEFGVAKRPAASIPAEDVLADLDSPGIHERAVLKWRDSSGKLQSEYTDEYHERHAAKKWARIRKFEPRSAEIRSGVLDSVRDAGPGTRDHAAKTIVGLIMDTGLRPGGGASKVYGISTLEKRHVTFDAAGAHLKFIGKASKLNTTDIIDPILVGAFRSWYDSADSPDSPIFPASAEDARNAAPEGVKLKDLRTLEATRVGRDALGKEKIDSSKSQANVRKQLSQSLKRASNVVADRINNTGAVARKAYIHPEVFREWAREQGVEDFLDVGNRGTNVKKFEMDPDALENVDDDEDLDEEGNADPDWYPIPFGLEEYWDDDDEEE